MRVNDAFPSKWLKAADLQGRAVLLVIERWEMAEIGMADKPEQKPVLFFRDKQKALVLNKANGNTIAEIHGQEMDDWGGKEITIYPTKTQFHGDMVDCIRVKLPEPVAVGADDEIPF